MVFFYLANNATGCNASRSPASQSDGKEPIHFLNRQTFKMSNLIVLKRGLRLTLGCN